MAAPAVPPVGQAATRTALVLVLARHAVLAVLRTTLGRGVVLRASPARPKDAKDKLGARRVAWANTNSVVMLAVA